MNNWITIIYQNFIKNSKKEKGNFTVFNQKKVVKIQIVFKTNVFISKII